MAITRVRDIMTEVVETLQVGDTLAMARRQIDRGGIHHLPVIDADEHVIGLITYHRLLEAWISHGNPDTETTAEIAGDVPVDMLMEKDVLTVDEDVTRDEKLVGILTASDLVHLARRYLEQEVDET
jgi:CBS domain-containing protein